MNASGSLLFYASLALLQGSSQVMQMQTYLPLDNLLKDAKNNKTQIDDQTAELKKNLDESFGSKILEFVNVEIEIGTLRLRLKNSVHGRELNLSY